MAKVNIRREESVESYTCIVSNAIERCRCGAETFYVTKMRDLYCAGCRRKVPNTTVYTNNFTQNSEKETKQ